MNGQAADRQGQHSAGLSRRLSASVPAALALLAVLTGAATARGQPVVSREHAIKAAYLYNFARYVIWPRGTFADDAAPMVIGVIGQDPAAAYLDRMARQRKSIAGRKVVIRRCRTVEDCRSAQVLFVGKSLTDRQREQIVGKLHKGALLVVGQTPGFARHGGAINFYISGNKVRFEINPDAAGRRGLKISSKLLALARIVRTPEEEEEQQRNS